MAAPLLDTVPFSVAPAAVTPLAAPVTAVGVQAAVVNVALFPLVVPALFAATTRKWYSRLQVNPVIAADVEAPEAPAASGLCAAVAVLP